MNSFRNTALLLILTLGLYACNSVEAPSSNFNIVTHGRIPESQIENISEVLAQRVPEIMDKLGQRSMPKVSVVVWQDREDFAEEFGEDATNVRGFINSDNWEVHLIDLRAPLGFGALHEYVHLISLAVYDGNGQLPIWLWESLAIYESRRPPPPDPESLSCIGRNYVPTLNELSSHPSNIYRIGYLLAEFIVSQWSYDTFRLLLRNGGDVLESLDVSEARFEQLWLSYILSTYDIAHLEASSPQQC